MDVLFKDIAGIIRLLFKTAIDEVTVSLISPQEEKSTPYAFKFFIPCLIKYLRSSFLDRNLSPLGPII